MRLEIDLGNSFAKWRVVGSENVVSQGRTPAKNLDLLPVQITERSIEQIWIGSVADDQINAQLALSLTQSLSVTPEFAQVSDRNRLGLKPAYIKPTQMGVDRWLALLGGWAEYKRDLIVIDAGSAITIDRMTRAGEQLGGFILPGYQMLQRSLLGETARVRWDEAEVQQLLGGFDTGSCVRSGVDLLMRGVVSEIIALAEQMEEPKLLLTGGDAPRLLPLLPQSSLLEWVPDLVLDGLKYAHRESL